MSRTRHATRLEINAELNRLFLERLAEVKKAERFAEECRLADESADADPRRVVKTIVRENAERDPAYCPYCCRCTGLMRMKPIERFLWQCTCGAVHDERRDGSGRTEVEGVDEEVGGVAVDVTEKGRGELQGAIALVDRVFGMNAVRLLGYRKAKAEGP